MKAITQKLHKVNIKLKPLTLFKSAKEGGKQIEEITRVRYIGKWMKEVTSLIKKEVNDIDLLLFAYCSVSVLFYFSLLL